MNKATGKGKGKGKAKAKGKAADKDAIKVGDFSWWCAQDSMALSSFRKLTPPRAIQKTADLGHAE